MPIINYNCKIKNIRVMKLKQLYIPGIVVVGMLTACGGGGGGGTQPAASTPAAPSTYKLSKHTVTDFESQFVTPIATSAGTAVAAPYWETAVTTTANADGSYTQARVYDARYARTYADFSADGGRKTSANGCNFIYTPSFTRVPETLALGQSWEASTTRTCVDSSTENTAITSKGSVVAIEPVTVAAGTFSALKTVTTLTYRFSTSTTVTVETCWRDTITGLDVKCELASTNTPVDITKVPTKQAMTTELGGYAQAATGRQKLNVERYAGRWQVWFTGTADGTCSVFITKTGGISGACNNNFGLNFDIAGTVDPRGTAQFNLRDLGATGPGFSGSFESPLKISGTWSAGTDSGTWYMLHL
jgi:hypothetical protein